MATTLSCANGHSWEWQGDTDAAGLTVPCPVCGAAGGSSATVRSGGAAPLTAGPAGTPPTAAPAPGKSPPAVPGYEILGELGRGGMGVVYKARQLGLDRTVALKMILGGGHASDAGLARFKAEAEAVARLQHPNIVQIHEVGEASGLPYFALEYVGGGTLARRLASVAQPPRDAAALVQTLARAVHYAHECGILHRDLKPGNVLLSFSCEPPVSASAQALAGGSRLNELVPKIADFGLAKKLEEGGDPLTATGEVLGTPSYMAPEQASGVVRHVGPGIDVYALGAILYELLTGRPPFQAGTAIETVMKVLSEEPTPPRRLRPDVPRDLEVICLKCLAKQPAKRYATAADLADDLRRFLGHEPIRARSAPPWERVAKWARRRPGRAVAVLLLLACGAAALWYWDVYLRVHVAYYSAVTRRWGAPEGIGPLTADDVRHRAYSYKLSRRGGQVERMEVVNGHGNLTPFHAFVPQTRIFTPLGMALRESRYEYVRDEQGRVSREEAYDDAGELLWKLHYTTHETSHYTAGRDGFPRHKSGSGAAYMKFRWSPDGFQEEIRFFDPGEDPQPNEMGVFGVRFKLDSRGLPLRADFLGLGDRPILCQDNYAAIQTAYDDRGHPKSVTYFGLDGGPIRDSYRVHQEVFDHDRYGNQVAIEYRGLDGDPTLHRNGYARLTGEFDANGDLVEVVYRGLDGKPTPFRGEGNCRLKFAWDGRGNIVALTYGDRDGQPFVVPAGYATRKANYDPRGRLEELSYHDRDDRLVMSGGHARFTMTYDDRGNPREMKFFDAKGRPAVQASHFVAYRMEHDPARNMTRVDYLDGDGKPTLHREGYLAKRSKYNKRGNREWTEYLSEGDKLKATVYGFAATDWKYNEHGKVTEETYRGAGGERVALKAGYAKITKAYDEHGRVTEHTIRDLNDKLFQPGKAQYARLTLEYDRDGNSLRTEYDARGQVMKKYFCDPGGAVRKHPDGWARVAFTYKDGRAERADYADEDGRPVSHRDGYAVKLWDYDEQGRLASETYRDAKGLPAARKDGCATVRWNYTKQDVREGSFDRRDRMLGLVYLTADRKPRLHEKGYARIEFVLEGDSANPVDARFYDLDGKPVRSVVLVAEVEPNGPGDRAGICKGDVLVRLGKRELTSRARFLAERAAQREESELEILRAGRRRTVRVAPDGPLGIELDDRVVPPPKPPGQ